MPSLHKILTLKAGVRATAQAKLFPRVKDEKHRLQIEKPACAPYPWSVSRPSFLTSFVSSFTPSTSSAVSSGAAPTLRLNYGKDRGLTASEALSRVVSTPSVHGPFRQSSQPLIDGTNPDWIGGLFEKVVYVIPSRRAREVLGKATSETDCPDERVPPRRLEKGPSNALSSARHGVWKERRWRGPGFELKDEACERGLASGFKDFIESREGRAEHRDDGARCRSARFEESLQKRGSREMFGELSMAQRVDVAGKVRSRNQGEVADEAGIIGAVGLQPLRYRVVAGHLFNGSALVPRPGILFSKALHDVSLAGEGVTLDRLSENDNGERLSEQSSRDGKSLKFLSGACNLPHPEKMKTGGEDAYFICPDKQVVGVADGVGGWADLGIDAGEYSRELMSQSMIAVQQEPTEGIHPARVMEKAHSMTKCKGSSTACILALTESGLEAANLGDSGFVIVRNSRTIFKSPAQQHQFNIPFQLENGGSDPPSAAQVFSLQVSVGDIIVAGTDGLFDNLYESELTTVVVQAVRGGMAPQVTAQKIAALARARAQDRNRQTPFSTAAQDAGFRFYGGKMDDITVIVSYITSNKSA